MWSSLIENQVFIVVSHTEGGGLWRLDIVQKQPWWWAFPGSCSRETCVWYVPVWWVRKEGWIQRSKQLFLHLHSKISSFCQISFFLYFNRAQNYYFFNTKHNLLVFAHNIKLKLKLGVIFQFTHSKKLELSLEKASWRKQISLDLRKNNCWCSRSRR